MTLKQTLTKFLTPKNTEEVKYNLFVKKVRGDSLMSRLDKTVKGHEKEIRYDKYRVITPAAWQDKINWTVAIFGAYPIKSLFVFALILFLAWSYKHDINGIAEIGVQLNNNYTYHVAYCNNLTSNSSDLYARVCFDNPKFVSSIINLTKP